MLTVDLEGALAQILALAMGATLSDAPKRNKAASSSETALQSVLVAGAGFEPAAFRL